jgi:hypothetical protein
MTRNVYYGSDIRPVAILPPGPALWAGTTKIFNGMKAEDPKGRMKLVAAEIAKAKADVVGLQELAIWRSGPAPASKVEFDLLHMITADLTLQDAVLVRNGVKVSNAKSGLFTSTLVFPTRALGSVPVKRG